MRKLLLALLAVMSWCQVQAGPAPWWRWESKVDGRLVCSQWSPGEGWKKFAGPFNNGGCREM